MKIRNPNSAIRSSPGFTLIELLVVVTIIVVLLALLMPGMEQAIYQAQLATCQSRLKSAATGVIGYAMESQRAYPYRAGPRDTTLQWGPNLVANRFHNDRPTIFSAARSDLLLDPFSPRINIETTVPDNFITTHYILWFGWTFLSEGRPGMDRMGDKMYYNKVGYSLLLSDGDGVNGNDETGTAAEKWESSSHPDRADIMHATPAYQDVVNPWPFWNLHGAYATYSGWTSQNLSQSRGELDTNYAYDDGSVLRFDRVKRTDERMAPLPTFNTAAIEAKPVGRVQVPR